MAIINTSTSARRGVLLFHVATGAFFVCLIALHYDRATGFTRFLHFGDRFAARQLPEVALAHPFVYRDSSGYDGQFYAQIATHPLLDERGLNAALDSPAYRSRRIGLPTFAWIAGAGYTPWVLQACALANALAWFALAALLLRWIAPTDATALLAWLGCVFGIGVMMSVDRALTDLPCALLIAVAVMLAERGRKLGVGATFALSLLTRDTSVLAAGLLLPTRIERHGAWLRAGLLAIAAMLPLALWATYVHRRFPDAVSIDPANFGLPFAAMIESLAGAWQAAPRQGWPIFIAQLLSTIGLSTQLLFLTAVTARCWRERWWRVGAPFALLFAVLGPAVWQDYPAAARAVIPMTLAFNVLLPRDRRWRLPLCVLGNLPVLHGLAYLFPSLTANPA